MKLTSSARYQLILTLYQIWEVYSVYPKASQCVGGSANLYRIRESPESEPVKLTGSLSAENEPVTSTGSHSVKSEPVMFTGSL